MNEWFLEWFGIVHLNIDWYFIFLGERYQLSKKSSYKYSQVNVWQNVDKNVRNDRTDDYFK